MVESNIKDPSLAEQGKGKLYWAETRMPVLMKIRERFEKEKPFENERILVALHMTKETGIMMRTLRTGGAEVALTASNRFSAQDDVCAALVDEGISSYGWKGETQEELYENMGKSLAHKPTIIIDDAAELTYYLNSKKPEAIDGIKGGSEETTGGVNRLRAMEAKGDLKFPMIAVNFAQTKNMFDNRYGTGQSALDGIIRATNILLSGKTIVIVGYGWCGRGLAMRASGMGANVIVTEVDPVKGLEALMDGFRVMPLTEAAKYGDIFITVTAGKDAISKDHIKLMKDKAVISNAGAFSDELDLKGLEEITKSKREVRKFAMEHTLENGKHVYMLASGELINLAAAEGHPSEVMDMSFANQVLSAEYVQKNHKEMTPKVYDIPKGQDAMIAQLKLESMGISLDKLTEEQKKYLDEWKR